MSDYAKAEEEVRNALSQLAQERRDQLIKKLASEVHNPTLYLAVKESGKSKAFPGFEDAAKWVAKGETWSEVIEGNQVSIYPLTSQDKAWGIVYPIISTIPPCRLFD